MKKIQGSRDFLRQEILSGYYKPGTYLPSVRCLAVRLKLSKSSVHNILKMLQEEGLLVLNPGRGALVAEFHPEKPLLKRIFLRPADYGSFNYMQIISRSMNGVFAAAERKNVEVNISFSDSEGMTDAMINAHSQGMIQGVIYIQCRNYAGLIRPLEKASIPYVIANDMHGFPAVKCGIDFRAMTRRAIEYLHRAGHTRIGILTGDPDEFIYAESLAAYREIMKELKLKVRPEWVLTSCHRDMDALFRTFDLCPAPTAYFTVRDYRASMVYAAAACRNLRIPRDLSVISFDDCTWDGAASAGLTTFREPLEELGENAVDLLQQWVASGKRPESRILIPELVERGSVSAPKPD